MQVNQDILKHRADICRTLKEKLVESLDMPYEPSDIPNDVSLIGSGLGLDSLDILEIVLCVEKNFGIKMPENGTVVLRSLNTLADFIISEQDKKCAI